MLSRVYLGVHTIDQVFGGLFFGLATVFVASGTNGQKMFDQWQNGETIIN
jgi:membrane-associated phospholipid phosphatase